MTRFNHLNVPDQWNNYFTRYPQGYTILEALLNWVGQVDNMVDNQNILNRTVENFRLELDDFISKFAPHLHEEVTKILREWQESGFLNIIINEALQTQIDEVDNRLTTQITDISNINVKHYGAVGDGVTDDTISIKLAINDFLSSEGSVFIIPHGFYKISETLDFNFKEKRNFEIKCEGALVPDIGIGYVVSLTKGVNIKADIRIKNGGKYSYFKGFSHQSNGVIDTGVYIRAISGLVLDITTDDFRGRGFEIESARLGDNVKTDMMNFRKINLRRVGQSCYIDNSSGTGCIGDIWALENDGGYIKATDISINSYENAMSATNQGLIFDGCSAMHLGRILIGQAGEMVTFKNCVRVTTDLLYLFGYNVATLGCKIENCYQFDIFIKSVNCIKTLIIDGLMESSVDLNCRGDKDVVDIISNLNSIQNVTINIRDKDTTNNAIKLIKGSFLFDNTNITGNCKGISVNSKDIHVTLNNINCGNLVIPLVNNVICNNVVGTIDNEPSYHENTAYHKPNCFPRNLIKNGNFNLGVASWTNNLTPTLDTTGLFKYDGKGCKITSTRNLEGIKQNIDCVVGENYCITFIAKTETGSLLCGVNGDNTINVTNNNPQYYTIKFKATLTTHTVIFYSQTGIGYVDGICVTKGVKPIGYIPFIQEI